MKLLAYIHLHYPHRIYRNKKKTKKYKYIHVKAITELIKQINLHSQRQKKEQSKLVEMKCIHACKRAEDERR